MASTNPGTTSGIQEIFMGRCLDYLEVRPRRLSRPSVTNCTEIWTTFSGAWIQKDPTKITADAYQPFFKATRELNIEKMLLWSRTFHIAHEYSSSKSGYVTLEDSLIGYLVAGLHWCGVVSPHDSGINYKSCPDSRQNEAETVFWGGASKTFASSLKEGGHVQVMLDGSNPERNAYNPDCYCTLYELPNLPKSATILVVLLHALDKPVREHCTNGSLVQLKSKVESYKFKFECVENPPAVVDLMCADVPLNKKCKISGKDWRSKGSKELKMLSLLGGLSAYN